MLTADSTPCEASTRANATSLSIAIPIDVYAFRTSPNGGNGNVTFTG